MNIKQQLERELAGEKGALESYDKLFAKQLSDARQEINLLADQLEASKKNRAENILRNAELTAQLAEARKDAERWREYAQHTGVVCNLCRRGIRLH